MKRALPILLLCYAIWGFQPLYWAYMSDFSPLFILCARTIMSAFCTILYLACTGRFGEFTATLRDKARMKYLVPATVFLAADWSLFIWATTSGHVLDSALGYYLNPMVIFVIGIAIFRERGHLLEYLAVGVACAGVVFSAVEYGGFPLVALFCAVCWPIYASIQKASHTDGIVSIAIESLLASPFALCFILLAGRGEGGFASMTLNNAPFVLLSGVVTALPMILYANVVNLMPFKIIGILQYAGTTLSFLCGVLFMNETVTRAKLLTFLFIWAGLVIFTAGSFRRAGDNLRGNLN